MKKILISLALILGIQLSNASTYAYYIAESSDGINCSIFSASVNALTGVVSRSYTDVTPDITEVFEPINQALCRYDVFLTTNTALGDVNFNIIDENYEYVEYSCPINSDGTLGTCNASDELNPATWFYMSGMSFGSVLLDK